MWLEQRVLLSGGAPDPPGQVVAANASAMLPASLMNGAQLIIIGSPVPGSLTQGGADVYEMQPSADGRLIAQVQAGSSSLALRLSLFDGQGDLLVASDGQSSGRLGPAIDQHVAAGNDFLEVQSTSGAGAYSLSTSLTPASDPNQTVGISSNYFEGNYVPLAGGDFTNNGILDLVAADGVHIGTGNGTFETPAAGDALIDPSQQAAAIAVGDFNGDGKLDAAVALAGSDSVSISLGNGDGTFQAATIIGLPAGSMPEAIVAGDFTGSGYTDLAVADAGTNSVTILQNDGQGNFQVLETIPVGTGPVAITAGDFENDGRLDLAVADFYSSDVTILSNQGGGVFQPLPPIALNGSSPSAIVAGNFGTGQVDLAVADAGLAQVDILLGAGDGTFQPGASINVGAAPSAIVAADFTDSGKVDLATADANSNDVSVLMSNGDGTFQPAIHMATGTSPVSLVSGDFNSDGRLDLATGNLGPAAVSTSNISVLLGKGDGTFEEAVANQTAGNGNEALATGDFTGNGTLGVAVLDAGSDSVTILPGNGDGTFQQSLTLPLPPGSNPSAIVAGDFNGDGRTDLAVAELGVQVGDNPLGAVQIFLGNGDGTFDALAPIPVAAPSAIVAGDFTGNGRLDLAVAGSQFRSPSAVTILVGNGDGTFTETEKITLGKRLPQSDPVAIVAGDFGNGHLDLAVADQGTNDVTVLMNDVNGDGLGDFSALKPILLPHAAKPILSLVADNFTSSGYTDLAVATFSFQSGNSIQVLLDQGNGNFLLLPRLMLTSPFSSHLGPVALVAGDFANNGNLDLATADSNGNGDDFSVYLGNGQGGFSGPTPYGLGGSGQALALVTGDFTGDGRTDLAIAQTTPDDVQVMLSNGDGTFSDPSVVDLVRRETPLLADLNGDGAPDVSVVDAAGDILYRAGIPGDPGIFAPPITVNPGDPSRDIAFVDTQYGRTLASVDANDDAISFFVLRSTGFVLVAKLATGSEPAEIVAADLDGNGVSDLVVRDAGDGTIAVYPGDGHGWFLTPTNLSVGLGASDVQAADLRRNGLLGIVYTDRLSGEVGVLENLGGGAFAPPVIYQAGRGPYGVTGTANPSAVTSQEETDSVTVGTFTPDGLPSIVALDPGSNTFGVLTGLGNDRFANAAVFPTDGSGLVVRAINLGNGVTGLAILTPGGLYVEPSDGYGEFLPAVKFDVGFEPNGLTVANLGGSGASDLLISNPLGDVEVLLANGNGSFQPPQNIDQQVAMTAWGPDLLTPQGFIYSDKLTDQVVVQSTSGVKTVLGDAQSGLVSPGAVVLADLNNNGIEDLIVANSGSNNVLVYPGLGNGAFATESLNDGHGFFTGTNPVGITVADLTGNGRPDLIIADKGSNNVSILLNEQVGNSFTFVPGPRLQVGVGPVATVVADLYGTGVPDLVVADSGSNNVMVLPGIGNGFFNDQKPIVYSVGTDPSSVFVGNFTGGPGQEIATVNGGSNTVSLVSALGGAAPVTQSVSSGGIDPTAAFLVPGAAAASLVVGNSGNGSISLFEGGENGLSLNSVLSTSGLPNPSALVLASFSGSGLEFWATNDGEQSASLLGFQLEESATEASSAVSSSATLLSLNESSLALVGTLLTVTLDLQSETVESSEGAAALVAAASGSAGQSLIGKFNNPEEELEQLVEPGAAPGAQPPATAAWSRYVSGLDQAIERVGNEADERLFQEQQPAKAEAPGTTLLEQNGAAPGAGTAPFVKEAALEAGRRLKAKRDRLEAIDNSLGTWTKESPSALRSLLPSTEELTGSVTPVAEEAASAPSGSTAFLPRSIGFDDRGALFLVERSDRSEQEDSSGSRLVTLVAVSATALLARESLLRRSISVAADAFRPKEKAGWENLIRHHANPANRVPDRWRKRSGAPPARKP